MAEKNIKIQVTIDQSFAVEVGLFTITMLLVESRRLRALGQIAWANYHLCHAIGRLKRLEGRLAEDRRAAAKKGGVS